MLEGGKITSKQASWLVVSLILSTAILLLPSIVVGQAKQDAWLSVILTTINGLLLAWLVVTLGLRFPDKTIIEYSQDVLGKFFGKLIGALYIFWLIYFESLVVREFGDFLITSIMRETPLLVFIIAIVFVAWFTVIQGLEVIARTNEFLLPFVVGSILLIVILVSKDINFKLLLPVFENGFIPIIKGAYTPTSWFGEIATMLMIIPYINSPQKTKKAFAIAVLVVGFLLLIGGIASLGVLGSAQSAALEFPFFSLARTIKLVNFIERLDTIIMALWVTGVFIKVTLPFYAITLALAQWFNLKKYQTLALPVGILLVALGVFIFDNITQGVIILGLVWPVFAFFTGEIFIPLLILTVAVISKKGVKKGG